MSERTFDPPRLEHVVIDEETQMQRYLAEIAMEDILLAGGKRRERPNGLMAQYKRWASDLDATEADIPGGVERVSDPMLDPLPTPEGYVWRLPGPRNG